MSGGVGGLLGAGEHCSHPGCRRLDFLPFRCAACDLTFCQDHRRREDHACASTAAGVPEGAWAIVCPLCRGTVKLREGEEANAGFERHQRSGACDPAQYGRRAQKKRCKAKGCKAKLGPSSTFTCRECGEMVCLAHRHPSDHQCRPQTRLERNVATFGSRFGAAMQQAGDFFAPPPQRPRPTAQPTPRPTRAYRGAPPAPASQGRELCPQCGATFANVAQLIAHSERAHGPARPAGIGGGGGYRDVCPQCGKSFASPVALVEHVQRVHEGAGGGSPSGSCVSM